MTEMTDRAAALRAAIQDVARDLEADLGKASRYRGTSVPSAAAGADFMDPGPDLDTYTRQKTQFDGRIARTLEQYRVRTAGARAAIGGLSGAAQGELVTLIAAIESIRTFDDAATLVATFQEA